MCARQGNPTRHTVLQALVHAESQRRGDEPLRILEIGSWAGSSAITWAEALKRHHGGNGCVVCVDAWKPYFHASGYSDLSDGDAEDYRQMEHALANGQIFDLFLHNIRACQHEDLVVPMKGSSEIVLPLLRDQQFDLVFVDGDHTFPRALRDIQSARRLVADGGILCGDDLELQLGEVDGTHARANGHRDYIRDPRTGTWYHPGLTLAVGEMFGEVSVSEGVWGVRRIGGRWELAALPAAAADRVDLPVHLQEDANPHLVTPGYRGYNIVRYRSRYYALAQSLGPVDVPRLSPTVLAQLRDRGLCVMEGSLDEVKATVDTCPRDVELIQIGYRGFNLVRWGDVCIALAQSLGSVDVPGVGRSTLDEWISQGACVVGADAQQVRDRLDMVFDRHGRTC